MSKPKKEQVIKVDKLVIHANEVKIITEKKHDHEDDHHERRRDPWGLLWGRRPILDREDDRDDT
ncbi:hypothetical protein CJ195_03830 [Bacillus sp. UMB0899]|uniref:hypothetical protein n=1 Tax=Metabacillus schmidteae TaxID=2730405 RepID=UPI000C8073B6|nr:hypothetical protein [Metabacillus schmidteae]PMC39080.1 hypothetical protein CJ195_03830 [Bacillus sp. UMB0899]